MSDKIDVSVIIPVHNASRFLAECLQSVHTQEHQLKVEVSVFLDSCTDDSEDIVSSWSHQLTDAGFLVVVTKEQNITPKGVGYAKNKAIARSRGEFLCFLDADDIMAPRRIQVQYELATRNMDAIIGSKFKRIPEGSTTRFTNWANGLTPFQLNTQIYTSNGPTVVMPTWFCHRNVIERLGGFDEGGRGTPEDLILFYKHHRLGYEILRADEELLTYRYHPDAATFSVLEETIWTLRVREIEARILCKWQNFTIWNAGKQGRKFYRSLKFENQKKVTCFCDVDERKIGSFYTYEETRQYPRPKIPILHFTEAKPPFILCMKIDLTGGVFEENLESLKLKEGTDYHHFN